MATIASLIVNVAADVSNINRNLESVQNSLGRFEGIAAKAGKVLAGAFAVGAIIGAGRQVLDFAGKLTDLAAKTGISTTGLQKLGLAFEQSGVSMETVAQSTVKLSKALLDGDKGVINTLGKLHLNLADLKRMAPEQQFLTIADAIGNIQNPTEKAYAAMQIFGKGGAELLQGLTGHLKQTTAEFEKMGLIIDEETVKAADDFGDQLGLMGKQLLGIVATIIGPLLPALSGLANILMKLGRIVGDVIHFFVDWIQKGLVAAYAAVARFVAGLADAATHIPLLGKHLGFAGDAANALRKSADDADKYLVKLFTTTTDVAKGANMAAPAMIGLGKATDEAGKAAEKTAKAYAALMSEVRNAQQMAIFEHDAKQLEFAKQIKELTTLQAPPAGSPLFGTNAAMAQELTELQTTILPGFKLFGEAAAVALTPPPGKLMAAFDNVRRTISTDLGPVILQALTGGGDVGRSVGGLLGGTFAKSLFGEGAQRALSGALGKTIGGAIGSVIPGVGTMLGSLVGPLLGKLGGAIKSLFGGPSQAELEGRTVVKQFEDQIISGLTLQQRMVAGNERWEKVTLAVSDAYAATGRSAAMAERDIHRLWDSSKYGADAARLAAEGINEALQEQKADADRLEAAIKKYGFTLEQLGPVFRRQQLDEQAKDLIEDWRVLVASGINVSLVNDKMAESINDYLKAAIATGTEVPSAFRPILQLMADQGKLVDAAGNKITDLGKSGVTFAETLTQGFDRVVLKLQELIDRLQLAGVAIQDLPSLAISDAAMRERQAEVDRYVEIIRSRNLFGNLENVIADRERERLMANPNIPIPMADGGSGMVTKPTLFLAGERGPEQFAFSGSGRSFASQQATHEGDVHVHIGTVQAQDADQFIKDLPGAVSRNRHGVRTGLRVALGVA